MVISVKDKWSVGQGVKTPPFHAGIKKATEQMP